MKIFTFSILLNSTIASIAWCAPPLATDDASTLAPGMCQFEIEQRQFRNRIERDFVPACNFLFDAEIGVGHLHVAPKHQPCADSVVYQFKKVIAAADANEWSFGINAATVRAVSTRDQSGTRQHYLNLLLSRQFGATLLHLNLGEWQILRPHLARAETDQPGGSPPNMKSRRGGHYWAK